VHYRPHQAEIPQFMSASARPVDFDGTEPLPTRLRRFREQCGISRSELAMRTGLSRPTIWAWESGKTQPRLSNLRVLANVLGISQFELVGGLDVAVPDDEVEAMLATGLEQGDLPAGIANPQRLSIMIYAAKLSIAALAGIKAQNVKISIEL
jgi:transcriptional regulator with XRE-family HTH domain